MNTDVMRTILELSPTTMGDVLRSVRLVTDFSGERVAVSNIARLPMEERAKHAARYWIDITKSDLIPRSKLLSLIGHKPGTTGAAEVFERLVDVLSLTRVKRPHGFLRWEEKGAKLPDVPNPEATAMSSGNAGDTVWRIGYVGDLEVYKDEEGEESERRIRAFLRVMKPVKIRARELACLVNIRYTRKFATIAAKVAMELPEYEMKIFRYGYGLNNGLVRRLTNAEAQHRARMSVPTSNTSAVILPHRFSLDPYMMIAPPQYIAEDPGLLDIMLEITDRRKFGSSGRRYMTAGPTKLTGTGPLGSDNLEDRVNLMNVISRQSHEYPREFAKWWEGGADIVDPSPRPTRDYQRTKHNILPKRRNTGTSADWVRPAHEARQGAEFVEQSAEVGGQPPEPKPRATRSSASKVSAPDGCVVDEHGVLRGPDGAKITRGPKWMR